MNWCRTETEFISVFILHFGKQVQGMQDVYINTRTGKNLKKFPVEGVIQRHAPPAPKF